MTTIQWRQLEQEEMHYIFKINISVIKRGCYKSNYFENELHSQTVCGNIICFKLRKDVNCNVGVEASFKQLLLYNYLKFYKIKR